MNVLDDILRQLDTSRRDQSMWYFKVPHLNYNKPDVYVDLLSIACITNTVLGTESCAIQNVIAM